VNQNSKFDPQQEVVKQIISDPDKNKTRYIVDMSEHDPLKNNPQMQNQWNEYILQHYKTIYSGTDYKLWERIF
jgi:hypothetical protein